MWGWVEDLGSTVVEVVKTEAKIIGQVATGDYGGAINTVFGHGSTTTPGGPGDLVKQVTQGKGTASLEEAARIGREQADEQQTIENDSRQMMTSLESAWTGKSSEAARANMQPLVTTAASASEALHSNSATVRAQIHQFSSLKDSLHLDVSNESPEKSLWDKGTPWDTDTEDAINQRNQKVQENKAKYDTYAQQTSSNIPTMKTNYGFLDENDGGVYEIEKPVKPPIKPPPKKPPKHVDPKKPGGSDDNDGDDSSGDDGSGDRRLIKDDPPIGIGERPPPTPPWRPPVDPPVIPGRDPFERPVGEDLGHTRPESFVKPPPVQNPYQQGMFGPTGGSDSSSGFGGGGFGPGGSGGFGPGGSGGFGPGGSGSGSGTGGQNLGAGKGSGAALPGESGGRGAPTGAGAAGAKGGRPGPGGMGGMGGKKGEGEEDAEHQRASYLVEADPESIFGSDARTAPPVIGE